MPYIELNEYDTINNNDNNNNYQSYHCLLSLELSSFCFGHNKNININGLKSIRNDTNCLLDPCTIRVILQILSNLTLTADNQQCMSDHNILLLYLLQLVKRRDIISFHCYFNNVDNDYSEIHIDALRIIAYLLIMCYSLMICCHLAANPNNHGILDKVIKHNIINNNKEKIKQIDSSNIISFNGMIDASNLMLFDDDHDDDNKDNLDNTDKYISYELLLKIINHIFSPNAQIKLYSIETLIYLFESNVNFTKYLFNKKDRF